MGMSINESIRDLVYLKGCGIFPFSYGTDGKQLTITTDECIAVAVNIMRKYQKIEEIVNTWHHDIEAKDFECMAEIADVVEDGNDDFVKEHKYE